MNKKEYNKKYKEAHKIQIKEYYQEHKEEILNKCKENYLKNRTEILKQQKEYHQKHSEEYKERTKEYQKMHPDYQKKYQSEHKENLLEYKKRYNYNKRKTDINFRMRCYLASRIWSALKGINKSKSTLKLLGCSVDFLRKYLELKFTKGMSFSNYGKWHIDHIIPCSSFDLSKPEEQRKCFHYTNLQPLWAKDNIVKSNNIEQITSNR